MRAPVRMFFVLDPLVALTNALATHALYRGLLWSLLILLPTLFLGRFFCGWICPMGTLQHFVGSMRSEAKRGKQRIESNRYKRWQTVKYVVLIAGLVAACFGSMAIGTLDPFSLLVRSIGLALLPAFNFATRALLLPHGAQPRRRDQNDRRDAAHDVPGHGPRLSPDPLRAEPGAGHPVPFDPLGQYACYSLLVPRNLPARCAAGRGVALVNPRIAQGCIQLRQVQPLPAALPGRGRSHWRRSVAQIRMPDVHELRGKLPARSPCSFASSATSGKLRRPTLADAAH